MTPFPIVMIFVNALILSSSFVEGQGGRICHLCSENCQFGDCEECLKNTDLCRCSGICTWDTGVLIAGGTGDAGNLVEVFHPHSKRSCALPNLPGEGRSQSTLCSDLLCGGLASSASKSCLRFDDDGQFHTTSVTLQQNRRYDLCWNRTDGSMLLGGPGGGLASLRSSEILKLDGSSSSPSFGLENNLDNSCGIDLEDNNYLVTGGYDSSVQYNARKTVSLYSTSGFQHDLPSLKTGRYGHACGKFQDKDGIVYFVAGGWNDHQLYIGSTEIFKDQTWSEHLNSLNPPRRFFSAVTISNKVFAFGGTRGGSEVYDEILMFDEDRKIWTNAGKMTVPRERHATQVLMKVDRFCSSCEEGWFLFNGKCYKYFSEKKTWGDAQDQCQQNGAHLVSIHSEDEHKFINSFNGDSPWVGGQRNQGNNWYWSDGTPWDYSNWASGAPHAPHFGLEDCAHIWLARFNEKWNDKPCSFLTTFVCKKSSSDPFATP